MLLKHARRVLYSPAFWLGGALIIAGIASNLAAGGNQDSFAGENPNPATEKVLREGTRIETRAAECRSAVDRLAIHFPDDGRLVVALENLASQRILKAVLDDPSDKAWTVTGLITEFQGRNYILLERVSRVLKH